MVRSISTLLWKLLKCISEQSVVHLQEDQEKNQPILAPLPKLKALQSEMAGAMDSARCSAVACHSHWIQGKLVLSSFQQTCIKASESLDCYKFYFSSQARSLALWC